MGFYSKTKHVSKILLGGGQTIRFLAVKLGLVLVLSGLSIANGAGGARAGGMLTLSSATLAVRNGLQSAIGANRAINPRRLAAASREDELYEQWKRKEIKGEEWGLPFLSEGLSNTTWGIILLAILAIVAVRLAMP